MLFELKSGKQGTLPTWLLGTMHLRNEAAFAYLEKAQFYIDKCTTYVGEINLDEAADVSQFSTQGMDVSVLDYMSQKHFDKLSSVVEKQLGVKLSFFRSHHPLILYNFIAESVFAKDKRVSLDQHLWNYAKTNDKMLFGLESVGDQVDILNTLKGLPPELYVRSLKKISRNFASFRRGVLKSAELYQRGDLRALHKKALKGNSKTKKVLVYDRNIEMANQIEKITAASDGAVFFAFGAGHFLGQKGVFRLLKQKGFSIKQVDMNAVHF